MKRHEGNEWRGFGRWGRRVQRALMPLWVALACAACTEPAVPSQPPPTLPERAVGILQESLDAATAHSTHVWRDTPPFSGSAVQAYVEIPEGEVRKWEFDMSTHTRVVHRVMPPDVGPYPVNYGFVPQTVAWDGDPFDALVLGPPIPGGTVVQGLVVGLLLMEDDKGIDSKVVLARTGEDGRPLHEIDEETRERIADFFRRYKQHEPGKWSRVSGWGTPEEGRQHVTTTHAFFTRCRDVTGACRVSP